MMLLSEAQVFRNTSCWNHLECPICFLFSVLFFTLEAAFFFVKRSLFVTALLSSFNQPSLVRGEQYWFQHLQFISNTKKSWGWIGWITPHKKKKNNNNGESEKHRVSFSVFFWGSSSSFRKVEVFKMFLQSLVFLGFFWGLERWFHGILWWFHGILWWI